MPPRLTGAQRRAERERKRKLRNQPALTNNMSLTEEDKQDAADEEALTQILSNSDNYRKVTDQDGKVAIMEGGGPNLKVKSLVGTNKEVQKNIREGVPDVPKAEILSKNEKVNKPTVPDKFADVRYPYSAITNTMDFMKFSVYKYVRGGGTVTSRNEESLLKKDRLGAVFLPIPSQLVDSNTTDYGQGSLNFIQEAGIEGGSALIGGDTEGAKKAINSLVAGVTGNKDLVSNYAATQAVNSLLGGSLPFSEVMARSSANVLNPNMELLFKGPTLRNFNFQFKFTPRFQKEAETVRTIIKIFKRNMAPRTQNAQLLKTPNIFEIQYIGKARDYLNRMKLCALRNVTMNYTGEGNFTTYNDGSPISMIMTLSFTELTPIYNEDYAAYDNTSDGVGY